MGQPDRISNLYSKKYKLKKFQEEKIMFKAKKLLKRCMALCLTSLMVLSFATAMVSAENTYVYTCDFSKGGYNKIDPDCGLSWSKNNWNNNLVAGQYTNKWDETGIFGGSKVKNNFGLLISPALSSGQSSQLMLGISDGLMKVTEASPVITAEFSMLVRGDFDKVTYSQASPYSDGKHFTITGDGTITSNGTVVAANMLNKWITFAITTQYQTASSVVSTLYLNGKAICNINGAPATSTNWYKFLQITKAEEGSSRPGTGLMAFDDFKLYTRAYEGANAFVYNTNTNDIKINENESVIAWDGAKTVSEIASSIECVDSVSVFASEEYGTALGSGATIPDGAIVLLKKGNFHRYLTVSTVLPLEYIQNINFTGYSGNNLRTGPEGWWIICQERGKGYPTFSYKGGIGKKADDDICAYIYVDKANETDTFRQGGMQVLGTKLPLSADNPVVTMEMSVFTEGSFAQAYWEQGGTWGLNLKITDDGLVYLNDAVINRGKPAQWHRFAITYKYIKATGDSSASASQTLYYNGKEVTTVTNAAILNNTYFKWMINNNKTDSFGRLAIDDYKYYNRAYDEENSFDYSFKAGFTPVEETCSIIPEGTKTVADLKANAQNVDSVTVYSDATYATELDDNSNLAVGNIVVLKKGSFVRYLTVANNIYENNFNNNEVLSTADLNGSMTVSNQKSVIYSKDIEDGYTIMTGSMTTAGMAGRFEIGGVHSFGASYKDKGTVPPAATIEFSALTGGKGTLKFEGRPFYKLDGETEIVKGNHPIFTISEEGKASVDNADNKIAHLGKNQWVRVALSVYPETNQYDLYINDEKFVDKAYIDGKENAKFYGYEWLSTIAAVSEAGSTNMAIDDIVVYNGSYRSDAENSATLTSDDIIIENNNIYLDDASMDISDFYSMVACDGEYKVYTDSIFTTEAEDEIQTGDTVMTISQNGLVRKYYNVLKNALVTDENITLTITNGKYVASVNASAPESMNKKGSLIIAVYKNGVLANVNTDSKKISGKTSYQISLNASGETGETAKAIFVNNINDITPYIPSTVYPNN